MALNTPLSKFVAWESPRLYSGYFRDSFSRGGFGNLLTSKRSIFAAYILEALDLFAHLLQNFQVFIVDMALFRTFSSRLHTSPQVK